MSAISTVYLPCCLVLHLPSKENFIVTTAGNSTSTKATCQACCLDSSEVNRRLAVRFPKNRLPKFWITILNPKLTRSPNSCKAQERTKLLHIFYFTIYDFEIRYTTVIPLTMSLSRCPAKMWWSIGQNLRQKELTDGTCSAVKSNARDSALSIRSTNACLRVPAKSHW